MNCDQAKQLIDLRVHEEVCAPPPLQRADKRGLTSPSPLLGKEGGGFASQRDWSELDAHLSTCPQCRAELEELRRVRGMLAAAANDRPSDVELQNMWMGIQTALARGEATRQRATGNRQHEAVTSEPGAQATGGLRARAWWLRNRSLVVSMTGVAAVLVIAFQVGELKYGRQLFGARDAFSNVASIPSGAGELAMRERRSRDDESTFRLRAENERRASPVINPPKDTKTYFDADHNAPAKMLPAATPPPALPPAPSASGIEKSNPFGGNMLIGGNLEGYGQSEKPASALRPEPYIETSHPASSAQHLRYQRKANASGQFAADAEPATKPRANSLAQGQRIGSGPATDDSDVDITVPNFGSASPLDTVSRLSAQDVGGGGGSPNSSQSPIPQNLKIIKTGELTIEVPAYADSMARVEQIVREKGGFVADGSTHEEAGGALVGHMVVRIAPEKFEEVFAALKAVGRVLAENVKAADVTAEYVDTDARIKSLQITEERLRDLIANKSFVDKIASLLEVEKEMNRVRTEIEQLQGQLRVMADRVGLSTIVLTIREPGRTVPSASLSVEVGTLAESASKMGDMLGRTDGRLVSGKTSKRSDGTLMGTYSIETNLARFAEVVGGIESFGRVEERQVKDQQFSEAGQPWAKNVTCSIALVLFERSRQLPTAAVRIEVDKLDATMKRLSEILDASDATLASNQASRMGDGSNSAEIKLRVPAGKFGGLFDALSSLGRMTSKSVAGESNGIVGGAAAVPCDVTLTLAEKPREVPKGSMAIEVATFDAARQALSRAIAERQVQVLSSSSNQRDDGTWLGSFRLGVPAKEMEGFVNKLESLGRVAARQITGLGLGDLSRIDPDSLGVIELTLAEKASFTPAPDEASASIRARIRDGLGGFYTSIGMIAYGLTVLLPWLLLAGILGWLLVRIRKAVRNRKSASTTAT